LRSRKACQSDIGCLEAFFPHTKCLTSVKLLTNMLDLLTVGPKYYAAHMSRCSSSYRSISAAGPRPTSAANPPAAAAAVRSMGQIDGRTDGRTLDRFVTHTAYDANRVMKSALRPRMQINNIQLQCGAMQGACTVYLFYSQCRLYLHRGPAHPQPNGAPR